MVERCGSRSNVGRLTSAYVISSAGRGPCGYGYRVAIECYLVICQDVLRAASHLPSPPDSPYPASQLLRVRASSAASATLSGDAIHERLPRLLRPVLAVAAALEPFFFYFRLRVVGRWHDAGLSPAQVFLRSVSARSAASSRRSAASRSCAAASSSFSFCGQLRALRQGRPETAGLPGR
jgi:hypothetical protein